MCCNHDLPSAENPALEVRRASSLGEECRTKLSEIFVDGFGKDLKAFSRDRETLVRALEHMFLLEHFFVARVEGEVAGIASIVFRQYFEKPPERAGEEVATVGFVATSPAYRGRGVAAAILEHLHTTLPYDEFILEVASNNKGALKLYERLGYREFRRDRQRFPWLSGFDYLLHMVYRKVPG